MSSYPAQEPLTLNAGHDFEEPSSSASYPHNSNKMAEHPFPGERKLGQHGMQPSFAVEYNVSGINGGCYGSMMNNLGNFVGFFGAIPCCLCCPNPYKNINQGYVGLISRFGKFYKCADPGLLRINPLTENIRQVDVKIQIAEIPHQIIMTKDNVTVQIDSVLYWHIVDPYQAVFGVSDVQKALIERTQTTLRHILGARVLQDCIENREAISFEIQEVIQPACQLWGVKVETILIKDIQFSTDLQVSLSSAAQAKRIGESKVIQAQAEVDSAKLMRAASDILNTPAAMQIRYLETLQTMSRSQGTKIIFMPMSSTVGSHFGPEQATTLDNMSRLGEGHM